VKEQKWFVGTLSYDRKQLVKLFAWLLWGDFVVMLMMSVMPQLLPLSLKHYGASNAMIGLLVGTIPVAINFIFNPIISTISDRHRGRSGRRLPFLLWPTPIITLFLLLVGYAPQLGEYCHQTFFSGLCDRNMMVLILTGIFVIGYQFFNLFVAAIYWYMLADVVPSALMGRFFSMMRLVSQLAGFVFGKYLFVYAEHYMSTIYLAIGLLYLVSFMAMCFGVKEGQYPPPEPNLAGLNPLKWLREYFKTCFKKPEYISVFCLTALFNTWCAASLLFNFIGLNDLHLSYQAVGEVTGWGALAAVPAVVLGGWMVDRIGATKLTFMAAGFLSITAFAAFFFINSYTTYLIFSIMLFAGIAFFQIGQFPMFVEVFPKEKYGQFSSANAMVACSLMMVNNYGVGKFVDLMHDQYRFLLLYLAVFWSMMLIPLVIIAVEQNKNRKIKTISELIVENESIAEVI